MKFWYQFKSAAGVPKDPWRRFRIGLGVIALVLVVGTAGYAALGLDLLDAFYQTVITISTVGYRELGEVAERYQIFTVFLILFGASTSLYTLGVLIETLFEGRLEDQFRRRRMQLEIDRLSDHVVLCGYGQVGQAITAELRRAGESVVVIDLVEPEAANPDRDLLVVGDATEDDVLLQAGLDRAKTLVVALNTDADNLFIVLTARFLKSDLFIVARANERSSIPKLRQAGADRVVNPHEIGGARMAALVSHPGISAFLDVVMRQGEFEVWLAEAIVPKNSVWADRSLQDCSIRKNTGATVLSVQRRGRFVNNPPRDFVLSPGDLLIAMGTEEQLSALKERTQKTRQP